MRLQGKFQGFPVLEVRERRVSSMWNLADGGVLSRNL